MGIEKITDRIMDDAKNYESSMMAEVRKEVNKIMADYKIRAETVRISILEKGSKNAEAVISRAESNASLTKRNQVLHMKANLISEVFQSVEDRVASMPESDFLELLLSILSFTAGHGRGEIIFNERDRQKFGNKFVAAANKKFKKDKRDSVFVLSDELADIRNGFILRYGNVETNCSLGKIIEAKKSALEPRIIKILFDNKDAVSMKNRK